MSDFISTLNSYLSSKNIISLSLNNDLRTQVESRTEFLNSYYSKIPLKTRVFVILNEITEATLPKCKCGCEKVSAINVSHPENGFREYSGPECSRKSKTIPKSVKDKLEDYQWLYNERIIQQKSIEHIAEFLGVSTIPVVKYLKQHGLHQLVDGRNRNSASVLILKNKNKLKELYESGLTCEQIAEQLGVSKTTVARWLNIHNITIRSPNSYERKVKKISAEENSVYEFICEIYRGSIQQSNRSILKGKELDIYLPEKNLAIEYNGLYSHMYRPHEKTEALIKDKSYHLEKTTKCEEQGIQLLQFFSDEWRLKEDIVKSMLKSKLQINTRIYARDCKKVILETEQKNNFLNQNHIQGEDKSKIKLGLLYQDQLVCVMTFGFSRFNSKYQWELSRFSNKNNINVIGGFSKLLKWFKEQHLGNIISYADRRYSTGQVYIKNGFKLIHTNPPSYYYVDKNCLERFNRMKFQKKLIGAYDCTEYEKAKQMGYNKIYDCGTLAFGMD